MSHPIALHYIKSIDIHALLKELGVPNAEVIVKEVEHFTEREAEKRDQIVSGYFGEGGVKNITESIVKYLLSPPKLRFNATILDVGAGSGFFTVKVAEEVHRRVPKAAFYAVDITPAMLSVLAKKTSTITPFLGVAENIGGSIDHARKYLKVPSRFDAVFSTLTLHHCSDTKKVFGSIRSILKDYGKAVVIDLCEHPFKEFREEMGDLHLGFNPSLIEEEAKEFFPEVHVSKMPGICCESSGRSAELFIAYLTCK